MVHIRKGILENVSPPKVQKNSNIPVFPIKSITYKALTWCGEKSYPVFPQ